MVAVVLVVVPVAVGLGGYVLGKAVSDGQGYQDAAREKAFKQLEPRLIHTFTKYEKHEKAGEYAKAISALKEHIALHQHFGSPTPDQAPQREQLLNDLIFSSQDKARALSRAFSAEEANLRNHDDSLAPYRAHHEYIENLKIVLPQDDAFLHREEARFNRTYPPISLFD